MSIIQEGYYHEIMTDFVIWKSDYWEFVVKVMSVWLDNAVRLFEMSCNTVGRRSSIELTDIAIATWFAPKESLFRRFVYHDCSMAIDPTISFPTSV